MLLNTEYQSELVEDGCYLKRTSFYCKPTFDIRLRAKTDFIVCKLNNMSRLLFFQQINSACQ